MNTGFRGAFVISWSQTEIDGLDGAPVQSLNVGAAWGWHGEAMRVDGPNDVLRLDQADGAENLRKRAARMVERLVGTALSRDRPVRPVVQQDVDPNIPLMNRSFMITDGVQSFTATVIEVEGATSPLLMFLDEIPPKGRDLWVVHHTLDKAPQNDMSQSDGGVICFTPGTRIRCGRGVRAIEDLREGDWIDTLDNGPQQIQWIGSRRMSGARLFTMPSLRPVRIAAHFLGPDAPDGALLVSPKHRLMVRGAVAQDLFNTPEVLVCAKDLINGGSVRVSQYVQEVTYIHIMLEKHQVVWANGVEAESFHPASAALSALGALDRVRLLVQAPGLASDPHTYGDFARRCLSTSEAAILKHAA